MDNKRGRTLGAAFLLLQGAVTALFPQVSSKFIKSAIGKNFDNASNLEAKPTYLRQLRALGVGMIAAAGTGLLLESREAAGDEGVEASGVDGEAGAEGRTDDE